MPGGAIIGAVDPGLSGAVAFLDIEGPLVVFDMPTLALTRGGKNKREIDAHALAGMLRDHCAGHVFVEQVGAMPGQGVTSSFAFGKAYGIVLGVIAAVGIPMTLVHPRVWKGSFGLTKDKDAARFRASQIMPQHASLWPLKKHDGRAEAALIAVFGMRSFNRMAE